MQFTDGCKAQYKCKHTMVLAFKQAVRRRLRMQLNIFGPQHGKRVIDGVGALWKRL